MNITICISLIYIVYKTKIIKMSLPRVDYEDEDDEDEIKITEVKNNINSDTIFKSWENSNLSVYTHILNTDDDKITHTITQDNKCRTQQLTYHNYNLKQICRGCFEIRFLLVYPTISDSFFIYYGKHKGKTLQYKRYNYAGELYVKKDNIKTISNSMTKRSSKYLKSEFYKLNNIYYYATTNMNFNKYIISLLVNQITRYKKFPISPSYIYAYSCSNKLNILSYHPDYTFHMLKNDHNFIRNLSPLSKKKNSSESFSKQTIITIIKHILVQCQFLSQYYFTHNEPSIKYLSFYIELLNFEYEDMHIQSSFKTVIEVSPYSSVSLYNKDTNNWLRCSYSTNAINHYGFPIESVTPKFIKGQKSKCKQTIPYLDSYINNRVFCYKIGNRLTAFNEVRKMGIPIFKSYDFICFMVSLLIEPEFLNNFVNTKYYTAWKNIWLNEEFDNLMLDIKNTSENNYETVSKIVSRYYVMVDALNYFFNY